MRASRLKKKAGGEGGRSPRPFAHLEMTVILVGILIYSNSTGVVIRTWIEPGFEPVIIIIIILVVVIAIIVIIQIIIVMIIIIIRKKISNQAAQARKQNQEAPKATQNQLRSTQGYARRTSTGQHTKEVLTFHRTTGSRHNWAFQSRALRGG